MRVLLVQPLGALSKPNFFLRSCYLEPLALEYLGAALERDGHIIRIEYGNITPESFKEWFLDFHPHVVGYSGYTYTFQCCLELARLAKALNPETINIFGGYHPTAVPQMASESEIDYVVIGEGERILCYLVNAIAEQRTTKSINGIAYKDENKVVINPPQTRIRNLDGLPLPLRNENILKSTKQYQIAFPPPSNQVAVAQVTFARGCPFGCYFCSSENMWGREVYWRDPIKVVDEIESLHEAYGTNLVYFPDLTFNVNLSRVRVICNELIKRNLPVHWWALFRVDNITDEILHLLKEAKCVKLSFGIESPNAHTIQRIKGKANYDWDKALDVFRRADRLGLIVRSFFMIGFPWETPADFFSYKSFLEESAIDELRITFSTPFPGTKYYQFCQANQLLLSSDYGDFTSEIPIIRNKDMNAGDLIELRNMLKRAFYCSNIYQERIFNKVKKFPHLRNSWIEYFEFLFTQGVYDTEEIVNLRQFIDKLSQLVLGQNYKDAKNLLMHV